MTRFKCVICGKITAGRMPVDLDNHRFRGDTTFRYPRRHKDKTGKLCIGSLQEAEWVDQEDK